jgi:hypothetical protein
VRPLGGDGAFHYQEQKGERDPNRGEDEGPVEIGECGGLLLAKILRDCKVIRALPRQDLLSIGGNRAGPARCRILLQGSASRVLGEPISNRGEYIEMNWLPEAHYRF